MTYVQLRGEAHYEALAATLLAGKAAPGLLVYLSVSPDFYGDIAGWVSRYLRPAAGEGWMRVVMEKPFGRDSESAGAPPHPLSPPLRTSAALL